MAADYHKTIDGIDTRGGIAPSDIPAEVRDKNYTHNQDTASFVWFVKHNLNKKPSIEIFRNNNTIYGEIEFVSDNELTITFCVEVKGTAILN